MQCCCITPARGQVGRLSLRPRAAARPAARLALRVRATAAVEKPSPAGKPAKKDEPDHVKMVLDELAAKDKVVIASTAPAVRVSIGEEMGLPAGTACTGKMVAALKELGFDYVFDTLVAADLVIMEERLELLERLHDVLEGRPDAPPLPMFTSCCPGWVNFVETMAPEIIPHVSSTKSPQMVMGTTIKNMFAEKIGKRPSDVSVVSVMPCVRKQGEADRIMMQNDEGVRDVDHVLTTKDLGQVLRDKGMDFASLPDEEFDDFMGTGSGAAALFGTTGGVMEAALRTVYDVVTGEKLDRLNWSEVRGLEGVKEASVTIAPHPDGPLHNKEAITVNVAVANGLGNAKKVLSAIKEGQKNYHFVEVMACPGGCIGGGGQPRSKDKDILSKRQGALYGVDERAVLRRSYESPVVKRLYEEWLQYPGSETAHHVYHTSYTEGTPPKFDILHPPAAPQPEASGAPAETFTDKDLQIDPELAEQAKQCDFCGSIST